MEKPDLDVLMVYVPEAGPRVAYILDIVFSGQAIITSSKESFLSHPGPQVNYSGVRIGSAVWVIPSGILAEPDIRPQQLNCFKWEGLTAFFGTQGDIPFDIFSAAFYLLSRYEEYLPHTLDEYGRYCHTNSVAYTEDFLRLPLVDLWMLSFGMLLSKKFPKSTFQVSKGRFSYTPTYDIDIASCYLHRPAWKNVLGFYLDLMKGEFAQVMERGSVYSGRKKDPFDTFDWIDGLHDQFGLEPVYFLLTIIKRGQYDKNLSARSTALRILYCRLAAKYSCGLHPSWQSGIDESLLEKELSMLESITGQKISISRNHYLRFTLPHTFRRLINTGITDDHSLAYGTVNGFRASFARSFRWYDLEKEMVTPLTLHPFCFMEANSVFHQRYSAQQAGEEMQYYHDVIKRVSGTFISLFHNHFLTEQPEWIAWRDMYETFLRKNFG